MYYNLLLALCICASVSYGSCALTLHPCSEAGVQACIAPMKRYNDEARGVLQVHSAQSLDKLCGIYRYTERCLQPFKASCTRDIEKRLFEGMEQYWDFLCGEGKDAFLKHQHCLSKQSVHFRISACNNTYNTEYALLVKKRRYNTQRNSILTLCRITNSYMDCCRDGVEDICGREAANYNYKMGEKILGPAMSHVNCPGKTSNTVYILVGCGCGLFAIGVIAVVLFLMYKKKRRPRSQLHTPAHRVVPAPPMEAPPMYTVAPPPSNYSHYGQASGVAPGYDNPVYSTESEKKLPLPENDYASIAGHSAPPSYKS